MTEYFALTKIFHSFLANFFLFVCHFGFLFLIQQSLPKETFFRFKMNMRTKIYVNLFLSANKNSLFYGHYICFLVLSYFVCMKERMTCCFRDLFSVAMGFIKFRMKEYCINTCSRCHHLHIKNILMSTIPLF